MVRVTGNSLAKPGMEGQGRQTIITGVSSFHAIKHMTENSGCCFKWWPKFHCRFGYGPGVVAPIWKHGLGALCRALSHKTPIPC